MLFAAAWLTWRERRPVATIAAAAAASVVLFFCHLMGLVFFLVLIGSAEAHAMWRERAVLVRSASLLPVLTGPMVLWLLTALREAPTETHWMTPQEKLLQLASPFINYVLPLDLISAALVFGGVALGIATARIVVAPRAIAGRRRACDPVRGTPVRSDGDQLPGYPHHHHAGLSAVCRGRSGARVAAGPAGRPASG